MRIAAALGTALKRGARVAASRESAPACRMIKRAMITGFTSAGLDVADLRVLPAAVARHLLKTEGYEAGLHVGTSQSDPEVVQIRFFEQPGIEMSTALQKEIEKNFTRGELRRVGFGDIGSISYPARVRESYAHDLLAGIDVEAIRARGFRLVVDYGFSAASFVLPLAARPLGCRGGLGARVHHRPDRQRAGAAARGDRPGQAARARRAARTSASSSIVRPNASTCSTRAVARSPWSRACCCSCS